MFLERKSKIGISESKYWNNTNYTKGSHKENGCTWYAHGRTLEVYQATSPLKMFVGRTTGGYPVAREWYKDWLYKKGTAPKVAGVLVFEGGVNNFGHVAICEEIIRDYGNSWEVLVSQSDWGGAYWSQKVITIKKGYKTNGYTANLKYIGCCYNPYVDDKRVARNTKQNQIEVLADMLSVRRTPNGVKYEGQFMPQGIFNVLSFVKSGNYTWAEVDKNMFCALNDGAGWTKTYLVKKEEYYTVKKGDTMSKIAKQYNMTLTALSKLNPQIKNINLIEVGQKVRVK